MIVGWDIGNLQGFIWDADHGARNLSDVLAQQNIHLPLGGTISQVSGVSADGRSIIGNVTVGGDQRSFVVRLDRSVADNAIGSIILRLSLPTSPLSVDVTASNNGPVTLHQLSPDELDVAAQESWNPNMGAGIYAQIWKLDGTGLGQTELVFHYDEQAVLQAGIAESDLMIYHFTNGQWISGGVVDPVLNTITLNVTDFSPFSLGVAIPEPASLSFMGIFGLLLLRRRHAL